MKLLEVKNLNTSFKIDAGKVLAVNGVSFSVNEGKVLGIVGESGSGKSVTAYSIMGILDKNGHVDSGKIIYKGTDLLKISEEEMREIRGNKISIIFQDAMTSLNPVYTIGNQLREAILTHSKDPVKEAIYPYMNAVRSDEQRIVLMKKGLANHPERDALRADLAKVEMKLIADREALEKIKATAASDLKVKEKAKMQEYKANVSKYDEAIKVAFNNLIKNFKTLGKVPTEEEVLSGSEGREKLARQAHRYDELNKAKNQLVEFKENFKVSQDDPLYKEKYLDFKKNVKAQEKIIKDLERRIKRHDRTRHIFVKEIQNKAKYGPRNKLIDEFKKASEDKKAYYWECKSFYRETKYSANLKALRMLEEVGINEPKKRLKQYPFECSGGMLQRCMIAMALVQKPDILIADEPTTALDVTIQAQILELLKKLQKEYGMAIIIITHDLGVVAQICDEVDIMYAGRIVERGTVDDIFYNPQHEYTKGLLNSMPKLDTGKEKLEPIGGNPVDLFCLPKGCAFSSRCSKCMEICIDKYPEEVQYDETGHAASCWCMIKKLHEQGKIDVVNGTPEGKPLIYNGAVIHNEVKGRRK